MKISATFFRAWVLFFLACQLAVVPTLSDDTTERSTIDSASMTYLVKSGKAENAHFGHSMANLGPLDADVIDDIIVSVPFYGHNNEGEMIILYLTDTGSWTSYKMISANTFGLNVQDAMVSAGEIETASGFCSSCLHDDLISMPMKLKNQKPTDWPCAGERGRPRLRRAQRHRLHV